MAAEGVNTIFPVSFTQPQCTLSWGLVYTCRPHSGSLEIMHLDTHEKLELFCSLVGLTVGYGVRKRKPKYSAGKSVLNINDVNNFVLCPLSSEAGLKDDQSDGSFQ